MAQIKGNFFKRRQAIRKSDSELEILIDGMDKSDGSIEETNEETSVLTPHKSSSQNGDPCEAMNLASRGNDDCQGNTGTVPGIRAINPFLGVANAVRGIFFSINKESQHKLMDTNQKHDANENEGLKLNVVKQKLNYTSTLSDMEPPRVEIQWLPSDATLVDEILLDLRAQESINFERKSKGKSLRTLTRGCEDEAQSNNEDMHSSRMDGLKSADDLKENRENSVLNESDKVASERTDTAESESNSESLTKGVDAKEIIAAPNDYVYCREDESTPSPGSVGSPPLSNEAGIGEVVAKHTDTADSRENESIPSTELVRSALDTPVARGGKRKTIRSVLLRSIRKLSRNRSIVKRNKVKNTEKVAPEDAPVIMPNCADDASVATEVIRNGSGNAHTGNEGDASAESTSTMVSISALLAQPDSFPPPSTKEFSSSKEDHLLTDELPPFQASMDSLELYLEQLSRVSSEYSKRRSSTGVLSNSMDSSDEEGHSDDDDSEREGKYVPQQVSRDRNLKAESLSGVADNLPGKMSSDEDRVILHGQKLKQAGSREKLAEKIEGWMKPGGDESDEFDTASVAVTESNLLPVPSPAPDQNSSLNLFSLYSIFEPLNQAVDDMGRRMNLVASGVMRGDNNTDAAVVSAESQDTALSTAIARTHSNFAMTTNQTGDPFNERAPRLQSRSALVAAEEDLESRDPPETKGAEREIAGDHEKAQKKQLQSEGDNQLANTSIIPYYTDEASCASMTWNSWVATSSLLAGVSPMLPASSLVDNNIEGPKDVSPDETKDNEKDVNVKLPLDRGKAPETLSSNNAPNADFSSKPPKKKKRSIFKKFFIRRKKNVSDGAKSVSKSRASHVVQDKVNNADEKPVVPKRTKSVEKTNPLLKKKVIIASNTKPITPIEKTKKENDNRRDRRTQIFVPKPAKKWQKKEVVEKKRSTGKILKTEKNPKANKVGKTTGNVRPIHLKVFNRNKNIGKKYRLQVAQSDRVNAWVDYNRYGKPLSVFRFHKVLGRPKIEHPDEVLVIVESSTISGNDCMMRKNTFHTSVSLPNVPGCDCVGRVYRCGKGAANRYNIQKNDRVCCLSPNLGGNARYVKVHAKELMRVSHNANAVEIACLMQTYATAYQCLHRCGHQPIKWGDKVLIIGGNTPLGLATIQLALLANASLVCASADPFYHPLLKSLGVVCLGSDTEECVYKVRNRMDIIVDCLCNVEAETVHVAGNKTGTVILTKKPRLSWNFSSYNFDLSRVLPNARTDHVHISPCCGQRLPARTFCFDLLESKSSNPSAYASDLMFLMRLLSAGKIAPKVSKCVPLESVPMVHEQLEHHKFEGDVVCLPWMVVSNDKKMKDKPSGKNHPILEKAKDDIDENTSIIDRRPNVEPLTCFNFGDRTADFIVSCLYDHCQVDIDSSSSSSSDGDYYFSDDDTAELY